MQHANYVDEWPTPLTMTDKQPSTSCTTYMELSPSALAIEAMEIESLTYTWTQTTAQTSQENLAPDT